MCNSYKHHVFILSCDDDDDDDNGGAMVKPKEYNNDNFSFLVQFYIYR